MPLDPQLAIMLLLKDHWNDTSAIPSTRGEISYAERKSGATTAGIQFLTSPVDETISSPQVTVVRPTPDDRLYMYASRLDRAITLSLGVPKHCLYTKAFLIKIRLKTLATGKQAKGQRKEERWLVEEEIGRILRTYPTSAIDVDDIKIDGGFNEDATASPDVLASNVLIVAVYHRVT